MAKANITVDEMMGMLAPNLRNDVMRELCAGFLDMRRAAHKPLTKMAWKIVANKTRVPHPWTDLEFACALMKSTEASWQGVFAPTEATLQEYGPIYVSGIQEMMEKGGSGNDASEPPRVTDRQMTIGEMMEILGKKE